MSTVGTGLMTALMMVVSSVFGVVAIDGLDAFTEERTIPQEKLDRAATYIIEELMLIDACLVVEECTVDSVKLNEKKIILLEKLDEISAYSADPITNEKPHLRHGKNKMHERSGFEDVTFEERISNKIIKLKDDLMMINACKIYEDCTIGEDILNQKEFRINMGLEKLSFCSENIEECSSHKEKGKQRRSTHR